MKKRLLFMGAAALALALTSCDIFDITNKDSSKDGSSYVDLEFSSETRNGYDRKEVKATMENLGDSIGLSYLPSLGSPKILVLPIIMTDYQKNATEENLSRIKDAFVGENNKWESVKTFYKKSSFGRLNLDITVAPAWFDSGKTLKQIYREDMAGASQTEGAQAVISAGIAWYRQNYGLDPKEFDTNGDGYIDAVWAVYSAPDYLTDTSLQSYDPTCWAYTYYADIAANKARPTFSTFAWASFTFASEGYAGDAHTFIHETGHMMGLQDYYDYNAQSVTNGSSPAGKIDMMDANIIDHNAFSKFTLGWVNPFLIDKAGEITLRPSATTGEFLILPTSDGWNGLPFDEYMAIEFYTPENLNSYDTKNTYTNGLRGFALPGIRIWHVDARLARAILGGKEYTFAYTDEIVENSLLAHSNTPARGGSPSQNRLSPKYRLLQIMDNTLKRNFGEGYFTADDTTLFHQGDSWSISSFASSFPNGRMSNDGGTFNLSLRVVNIGTDSATITFQ